jgi:hypothetical protein
MSFASLSSAQLHRLIQLVKEKEEIQAKLAQVNRSLDALQEGKEAKESASKKPSPRRGRRRATLKDGILKKLQAAGKEGLTVKELAASLKAKPASVSVWFYTTGKKIKGIEKVGKARFAYTTASN